MTEQELVDIKGRWNYDRNHLETMPGMMTRQRRDVSKLIAYIEDLEVFIDRDKADQEEDQE